MFSLLKIWAACPHLLSVFLIRCKNEAPKKLYLKRTIECFKEVKIDQWINGKPDHVFSGDIQS